MDGRRVLEAAAASAADGSVGGLGARAARGAGTHAEAGAVEDIRRVGARRAAAAVVRAQERLCKQHTYDVYIHEYLACETVYVCMYTVYIRTIGGMHAYTWCGHKQAIEEEDDKAGGGSRQLVLVRERHGYLDRCSISDR